METRHLRALTIAATTVLTEKNGRWNVPSQSGKRPYTVRITPTGEWSCTCPDFEEHRVPCKHALAVEITCRRESRKRPESYSEEVKAPKTYPQDWAAYNAAQCDEKRMFLQLLHELCATLPQPVQEGRGRRYLPIADMVFAATFRTYTGLSARRFTSDLRWAQEAGFIEHVPCFTSVLRYLAQPELTPLLTKLVELTSYPLSGVETEFAIDSSGFGTSNLRSWYSIKHGRMVDTRIWAKAHVMTGTLTNIVTAVKVTPSSGSDMVELPGLARTTARRFAVVEVSADKGYSSMKNASEIEAIGAVPYIAFKNNTKTTPKPGSAWARMYHRFACESDVWFDKYHRRSNVETTFHMVKSKFGDTLRGRTDDAQINEVLTKILAHNLCVLVSAFYELGIETDFAKLVA